MQSIKNRANLERWGNMVKCPRGLMLPSVNHYLSTLELQHILQLLENDLHDIF